MHQFKQNLLNHLIMFISLFFLHGNYTRFPTCRFSHEVKVQSLTRFGISNSNDVIVLHLKGLEIFQTGLAVYNLRHKKSVIKQILVVVGHSHWGGEAQISVDTSHWWCSQFCGSAWSPAFLSRVTWLKLCTGNLTSPAVRVSYRSPHVGLLKTNKQNTVSPEDACRNDSSTSWSARTLVTLLPLSDFILITFL